MIQLLPHQKSVLEQTEIFHRVAYYLDMGLGKSFLGSEKMHQLKSPFALVICQKSKVDDWAAHFREHYDYHTVIFNKQIISEIPVHSVLIINYDLVWRRPELLKLTNFTLILDESSCIKNETRRRSKFILKLRANNVILLSGTPTGGKYEELWSQCKLLGWMISKKLFWKQFIETRTLDIGGCPIKIVTGYKNVERLKTKLREHGAVFMKTEDVLTLPETIDQIVNVQITKEYRRFKKDRVIEINGKPLIGDTPLTQLLYLRQLAGIYNENKIERLTELFQSTGDRLIVFYNFDLEYGIIKLLCEKTGKPISAVNGKLKDLKAYEQCSDSVTLVQYQAGATIDWNNVDAPTAAQVGAKDINWNPDISDIAGLAGKMTHIDQNGIYTGTLTAQQINALLISGVTITALEELAIRGFADTNLGRNPRLVWQCADSVGESSITDIPTNPGSGNAEADTLSIIVNSNDPDGEWEVYRGGVYIGGRSKLGNTGLADLIVHGTIQVGNGGGLANAPWGVDMEGNMTFNPPSGGGKLCSINPHDGQMRLAAGENYIRVNQPTVGGSILDVVTLIDGVSTTVVSIGESGDITAGGTTLGGGGDPAVAIGVVFSEGDMGVRITRDNTTENWSWTKDSFGKITSMISDRGRTITITY